MKSKKPTSKPIVPSPECRVCGLASEAEGQSCPSCMVMHQELIDLAVKRAAMIRYAPFYFCEVISFYRNWLRENRRQRALKRAKIIAEWLDKNKRNKAYQDIHLRFIEFLESRLISQAEAKVEEMSKILEKRRV